MRLLVPLISGIVSTTPAFAEFDDTFLPFIFDTEDQTTAILEGPIDDRTPFMFSKLIRRLPRLQRLLLASPGGDVYSAITIAHEINRLRLDTEVPQGYTCLSACSFLFMAGDDRQVYGQLGVHQISASDPDLSAAQIALSDISQMLTEFGVTDEVFVLMLRTPPTEMYIFSEDELGEVRPY
jgi:hypothetical protein